ncbi:N-terminal acetyltransferase B complex auxiliary subunit NAA25 [Citrus sinensis]|uniref:N-terminal acetyltransferase B complex auxiliary subunit NAA25 n=1 Tax=Citrus sinensis TaxID=2711 RepID=A0ACB8IXW3_CITSI|nr:N-terminal acetyltransferase B complex auxiliary subunit NAA25 [Citrus sinensis]
MASKFGLAGGIPERRVRPIWDAIDSRQFKNALKQSTALLAKYPNSPYALALKALVLERMGKCDESLSVSLQAKDLLYQNDSTLMDDLTLSTLQIVFQRLDRLDLATSCYEYACGKYPNNMDHMMGLFNCYVREYSFVKQQQTAIKMYKHAGEERFLLWAVCSIQLQVLCGNGGEKLLLLAEGLLKKHVASHSLHEPEALIVYISILEQQSKYGDALEILSGTLGSLLVIEVDKLRMQLDKNERRDDFLLKDSRNGKGKMDNVDEGGILGRLLARQGDYTAAAQIYKKILELSPDDWECFLHYLGCLLEDDSSWCNAASSDPIHPQKSVDCKFSHLTDEVFNSRISDASTSVKKLQADTSVNLIRCPYLANLEIERRKLLYGKNNDDELLEAVLEYFLSFGHLACFTSDVEDFLLVLSLDKKTKLLERLKSSSTSHSTESIKELGRFITLKKIQELIGNTYKLLVDELERSAVQMSEMYCKSLPLSKDLDPQESIHGEELLSMASNVLVQLFWRTSNYGYFMEAIMVLEFGLTVRRHAWQYKVLLVHLYSHLGALPLAYEWYKALDVKNILMETVSHHILPQMLVSSLWVESNNLLRDYLRFMDDHLRESADLTFLAYRHRNYSKVIEFVQFKERLQRSSQYLVARVESSILQLKQNADNIEEEESVLENLKCGVHFLELSNEIGSKSVTFNEDWQSRPWWAPTPDKNYLLGPFAGISYCPKENLTVSACVKENFEVNGSICDPKVSSELKYLLDRYAKMLGFSLRDAVEVVSGVSSGLNSSEAFGADMVGWLNFAVFLNAWNLSSHEVVLPDVNGCRPSTWQVVNTLLKKCILEVRSMESLVCYPRLDLSVLVQLVTEPLAWHTLVMQSCVRSSLPSGKKKKKSGSADHSTSPLSHDIRGSVQSTSGVVEEVAKWLGHHIKKSEDEKLDAIFSSLEANDRGDGPGQVFRLLGTLISSLNEAELGDRISQAMKSWSPVDVARKFVAGQRAGLSAFLRICESKIKSLQALKQQMAQLIVDCNLCCSTPDDHLVVSPLGSSLFSSSYASPTSRLSSLSPVGFIANRSPSPLLVVD